MLGFQSFHTAIKTLKGIEIMHMIKKGQVDTLNRCVLAEVNFINKLFGIAAYIWILSEKYSAFPGFML